MPRKSSYNPAHHIPWVRSLARQGLTLPQIAEEIGVARSTLCLWAKKDDALSDALNEGRSFADSKVVDGLYQRAMGMTVTDKKTILSTKDGKTQPARIEITEKQLPPDPTACIFWLKNRQPKKWRDKPDMEIEDMRPILNITVPAAKVENDG